MIELDRNLPGAIPMEQKKWLGEGANNAEGGRPQIWQMESSRLVPWLMLACIMAGLAIGLTVANMLMQSQITDAKLDARMAKFDAAANAAKQDARIALDKVEQTQVQLGAKGIVFPSTH